MGDEGVVERHGVCDFMGLVQHSAALCVLLYRLEMSKAFEPYHAT
jgi:hypothetical protein